MNDEYRRLAVFGAQPEGTGPAGLRCRSLMYGRYTALTAPCPAKKWPPSLAFP